MISVINTIMASVGISFGFIIDEIYRDINNYWEGKRRL